MIRLTILMLLALFLVIPSTAMGQICRQLESLGGIDAFHAHVSVLGDCPSESEMKGVEANLQVRLELSLRSEEVVISPDAPTPELDNQAFRDQSGRCVLPRELGLYEVVPLRGRMAMAITWERAGVGLVGSSGFREAVYSGLDSLLTFFLNDYLTANPKR